VDFGTGGVYNRQPARRVVSSDREWMTEIRKYEKAVQSKRR